MIENRSRTALNNSLKHYFYYQMCELLILFLVGVALVMGVKHMVPGASIV